MTDEPLIRYVYVAGPLTQGEQWRNVREALLAADELLALHDLVPYVPHLSVHWDTLCPHDYETWMRQCLAWVERCDALLRLPGESPGSDREVAHAKAHGLVVFYGLSDLRARIGALL